MQDYHPVPLIFFILAVILTVVQSSSLIVRSIERRKINPLNINTGRAPNPYNEPGFSAGVVHDPKRLPAEIGGIVAAYGISLVLVAIILLSLSRKRRQHLRGDIEGPVAQSPADLYSQDYAHNEFARLSRVPVSGLRSARALSFSYPPPIQTEFNETRPYIYPSPTFSAKIPGVDPSVDQRVVRADRKMAQNQLEEMYKHVMEHEEAKQKGIVIDAPTGREYQNQQLHKTSIVYKQPQEDIWQQYKWWKSADARRQSRQCSCPTALDSIWLLVDAPSPLSIVAR
ncbi:hypothetical protein RJ55_00933 [Drechmeria coniospora]|nr:hypothetical protein RJ55_00933 [Drechmeria coniospora]